jgi:hypothetical protein
VRVDGPVRPRHFILYDSVSKLLKFEHPPIDLVKPFGDQPIWLGWLMLAALAWSALPAVFSAGPNSRWPGNCTTRCCSPTPR